MNFGGSRLGFWFIPPASFSVTPVTNVWNVLAIAPATTTTTRAPTSTTTTTAAPVVTTTTTTTTTTTVAPRLGPSQAIFGFGTIGGTGGGAVQNQINLVNNLGNISASTSGVGTARRGLAGAGYGVDKAIFGYGWTRAGASNYSITNLVNNLGNIAADVAGVGTARFGLAAATYGGDKAIFAFGALEPAVFGPQYRNLQTAVNLVNNTGVVVGETSGVGYARAGLAAAGYGGDKAIFAFGFDGNKTTLWQTHKSLVDNNGAIVTDELIANTGDKVNLAAATYGGDKAIFAYGKSFGDIYTTLNLVDNLGNVSNEINTASPGRFSPAGAGYGGDKAVFAFGGYGGGGNCVSKVDNNGVIISDDAILNVNDLRYELAAASFGI